MANSALDILEEKLDENAKENTLEIEEENDILADVTTGKNVKKNHINDSNYDEATEELKLDDSDTKEKKKERAFNRLAARRSGTEDIVKYTLSALCPYAGFGIDVVKNTSGLDVLGKVFSNKDILTDDKYSWNSKQYSTNLFAQLAPDAIYSATRYLCPNNRAVNLSASSLYAINGVLNNIFDGRGAFNYGSDSKGEDIVKGISTLIPLVFEFFRPNLPWAKLKNDEAVERIGNFVEKASINGIKHNKKVVNSGSTGHKHSNRI